MPSPLHIVLLAHPDSTAARSLAEELVKALYGAPATLELRVPTFLGPARPDGAPPSLEPLWKSGGEAVLLVYLLDARMARRVDGGTGEAWGQHIKEALSQAASDRKHRSVVPLTLDAGGFSVIPVGAESNVRRLPEVSMLDAALQHIAIRALYLLSDRAPPSEEGRLQAPIRVFLSHAKADLKKLVATDPVKSISAALEDHAVERFFDSSKIAPGENFAVRIPEEARSSDVMVVVWTDNWNARPWCRRELLEAKRLGRAVVVVDALNEGAVRAFPYIGNATWVRWRAPIPPKLDHVPSNLELSATVVERERVLTGVVLAAFRTYFERRALGEPADPSIMHLGSAPEALDVAVSPKVTCFVHPDPPVSDDERGILAALSDRVLTTPLTQIARTKLKTNRSGVVVSVSSPGRDALAAVGLTSWHVDTVADEVHLGVLLMGLRIVYGGLLTYESNGPSNFVRRLFDLVGAYGELAREIGTTWRAPVVNVPPWPLHLSYGDKELDLFGTSASLERGPKPDLGKLAYTPWSEGGFPRADSVERLLAVGLGLRAMRNHVTREVVDGKTVLRPRILVGGPSDGCKGWLPGLVEEGLCSLRAEAPLYLLGGFGGAAAVVATLLAGGSDPSMTDAAARANVKIERGKEKDATIQVDGKPVAVYDAARDLARSLSLPFDERHAVAVEIQARGKGGVAAALRNGLDDDENRELLQSRDGRRILELLVKGLASLP